MQRHLDDVLDILYEDTVFGYIDIYVIELAWGPCWENIGRVLFVASLGTESKARKSAKK